MMNQFMGGMFNDPFALTPIGMNRSLTPFGGFPNMMMGPNPVAMMQAAGGPGTSFYSSVVSFSSDGNNPPQVYEETNMNRIGPNGVREEKHTVRDSRSGVQKMKIGRHIQDRGHVIERSKNHHTGDQEENNEFINIDEEEAPQFNQEWTQRMSRGYGAPSHHHYLQGPSSAPRLAITNGSEMASPVPSPSGSTSKLKNKIKQLKKDKKIKKHYKKE